MGNREIQDQAYALKFNSDFNLTWHVIHILPIPFEMKYSHKIN